ncbi:MAG TPA: aminoacyl-tRNA hydrolase [Chlamydiales bacterium]|nr:aminoacyl-tRNA hydrolase [Chlamydiales bacterium]
MDHFLVVGLGNPGKAYENTRHNIGFAIIDLLARKHHLEFRDKAKFKGMIAEGKIGEVKVTLLKPLTFMNLSGESVASVVHYLQILPSKILVVVDDVDLPMGQLRLKINSGAGTHNGLKSVEHALQSNRYARLRIGVGEKGEFDLADFVLSRFTLEEEAILPEIKEKAIQAIEIWLDRGITRAMDFANRNLPSNPSKEKNE